jgi:acetyl esterase/lipase
MKFVDQSTAYPVPTGQLTSSWPSSKAGGPPAAGAAVPPTLLIHAKDDPIDPLRYSEVYARALRAAGAPVQLKVYETGGHAFGVAVQGTASDRWRGDALAWLREIGVLDANEAITEGAGAAAP